MATTTARLQAIAAEWGVPDDPTIIVDLIKSSGLLQTALVAPANLGTKHRYKNYNSVPTVEFRNLGEGIVPSTISKDMNSIDLWPIDAILQDDYRIVEAYPGGKAGYVEAETPGLLEGVGQGIAKQIYYGTSTLGSTKGFLGLHQYAKAFSNVVAQCGGTTGGNTSIFAVRWDNTTGASLRVPKGSDLIQIREISRDTTPVSNVTSTATNAQLPVYQWLLGAMLGLIVPAKKAVAAITQIDSSHLPTAVYMNKLLAAVRAASGQTYIYCNNDGLAYIETLKDGKLNLFTESKDYDTTVGYFRNIPVIVDENITSTETSVLD